MIVITTLYKGKIYEHKYESNIYIGWIDFNMIRVEYDLPPIELRWTGSGNDYFCIEDIVSIRGE